MVVLKPTGQTGSGSLKLVLTATGTCRVEIDRPQGRIQNVNTHLRRGGTGGAGVEGLTRTGWMDEREGKNMNE